MDKPNLRLPDPFDAADVGALIAAYAPELEPQRASLGRWLVGAVAWLFVFVIGGGVMLGPSITDSPVMLSLVVALSAVASWGGREIDYLYRVARYERTIEKTPYVLHEQIAEKFLGEIEEHRRALLGADTEWFHARRELRKALEEARTSRDYWSERFLEDPSHELARQQAEVARGIYEKLSGAVDELNAREHALLEFFAGCEAKVSLLVRSRSDYEESERLVRLGQKADELVMDAKLAIEQIGRRFVRDAVRVGQALGALERLQLKESAGEIVPERIELVAERILEGAEEERRKLAELVDSVRG